ncbi:hypothetical protein F5X71_34855 [Nocardia brasiliensis]|uniref:Helix-turn-helix domain-containing protein n=1 Tax=Nocardia brasiliensis TaxID=37326 RepID=A0A6G9Y112_NOCBR|nr:hypothetical protein [Nocardia brasiliensis]QIS06806.1 hypothetical protein F5X71_34855 [Nocardia brasiliensis]
MKPTKQHRDCCSHCGAPVPNGAAYSYCVAGAMDAFGLSRSKIYELARNEVVTVRYEGTKLLVLGESLRRYIDALPAVRA